MDVNAPGPFTHFASNGRSCRAVGRLPRIGSRSAVSPRSHWPSTFLPRLLPRPAGRLAHVHSLDFGSPSDSHDGEGLKSVLQTPHGPVEEALTTDLLPSTSLPTSAPERTRRRPRTAWWAGATVGVAVVFFVTVASLWLNRPGLYMDEANFVDAALGGHFRHQDYVYQSIGGVLLLIIPYIGTLKAAMYAPIFVLWGVSVTTIRVPVIIISAATLILTYFMARPVIGRWSAILVLLMGTCPTFIIMSKVDWGPIVIAMFLTVALLLAFLRYVNSGGIGWLWAVFSVVVIGVFDKQNFSGSPLR